ncbi:uncharacterized protein LOC127747632 [Arachis duranensis]|uniref:Uncharacterized protein LOC127747632 n=1 Tax=Arachis duranensis TaxID=130453 RepID=A0A9C6TNV7_ARADU|nr:uncharacterized protein LOC127747632 [Arachis duranensis]
MATRVQNSWRVCIDYRRPNQATRKDHYPLPFIDQMLDRLSDLPKVDVISGLPYPSSVKEVRSILGHKDVDFELSKDCMEAFNIMCDASNYVVGAALAQREGKDPYIIAYASKTLDRAQSNYTTIEKELLAIAFALDKFQAYLLGTKTEIQSVYNYETTELVHENKNGTYQWVIKPKTIKYEFKTNTHVLKIG